MSIGSNQPSGLGRMGQVIGLNPSILVLMLLGFALWGCGSKQGRASSPKDTQAKKDSGGQLESGNNAFRRPELPKPENKYLKHGVSSYKIFKSKFENEEEKEAPKLKEEIRFDKKGNEVYFSKIWGSKDRDETWSYYSKAGKKTRDSVFRLGKWKVNHYFYEGEQRKRIETYENDSLIEYAILDYHPFGKTKSNISYFPDGKESNVMTYQYLNAGFLAKYHFKFNDKDGNPPNHYYSTYHYDSLGRVTSYRSERQSGNEQRFTSSNISYEYDSLNRKTKSTNRDPELGYTETTLYFYDEAGNLKREEIKTDIRIVNSGQQKWVNYKYNDKGLLRKKITFKTESGKFGNDKEIMEIEEYAYTYF